MSDDDKQFDWDAFNEVLQQRLRYWRFAASSISKFLSSGGTL